MFYTKYKIQDTKYKFRFARRKAFTLIEMLVTISIIALLTTMVLAYSHAGQSISNLRREAEQLVSNLRRAESLSMLNFGPGGEYKEWGIKIESDGSGYSLFSRDSNGQETTKSSVFFRKGMHIVNGTVSNGNGNSLDKKFLFIPPEPTAVYITDDSATEQDITEDQVIILKLTDRNFPYYEVRITPTGMIYKKIVTH